MTIANVETGLDRLLRVLADPAAGGELGDLPERLRAARVGFVTNHSAVTRELRSAVDALSAAGVRLAALFGPEHGVRGEAAAGEKVESRRDPQTGVPVQSLYGATHEPTPEMLAGIDLMLFDIQDVGARFYTYESTLSLVMGACGKAGIPVVVLDRPNPLGGLRTEGPILESEQASFVGLHPIPIRHGLTMGELARLFHQAFSVGSAPEVVPMRGWRREMRWEETGLLWVPPSPNIPTPETARVYPGTCLIEGTVLSEGRGTAKPFEWIGAPWVDAQEWAEHLNRVGLPGARFRPTSFIPTASKCAGQSCGGVQVHITDPQSFRPVTLGAALLHSLRALWPEQFAWRESGAPFFIDRLAGTSRFREAIDSGAVAAELEREWDPGLRRFDPLARSAWLYPT